MTATHLPRSACARVAGGGAFERQRHRKDASFSLFGLKRDASAHGLDQAPGDGEPQARAFKAARMRRIRLDEFLEDECLLIGRYADAGIGH
jgi:hypothetical protein